MVASDPQTLLQEQFFQADAGASVILLGGLFGTLLYLDAPPPQADAGYEVAISLDLPPGAVVSQAVVHVAGAAPNNTTIGKIATVRASAGDPESSSSELVVDFGTMRTVSGVSAETPIHNVTPWSGTGFDVITGPFPTGNLNRTFLEMQTERLLVSLDSAVSPDTLASTGGVTTSTPPSDLELSVAGVRAWFRQGPTPPGFGEDVDITAAVQDAVAAGTSPVPVVLSARVPGALELSLAEPLGFLHTHVVQFGSQDTVSRELAEEGSTDVVLPLPPEASTWKIHRVVATVQAEDRGPTRVQPPVGPEPLDGALLVLDPDRRLVARLAGPSLDRFERLDAIRVRLTPSAGGIEIAGGLLDGTDTEPGDVRPDGAFTAVTVAASAVDQWVTLPLARAVDLPTPARLWVSIAATRGDALLGLADAAAGGSLAEDDLAEVTVLRRIAPNGIARPPSTAGSLRTDALALRLVGEAPADTPIEIVDMVLVGPDGDGDLVPLVAHREPADTEQRFSLALDVAAPAPGLALRPTVTAATRLTIGPVVVAYEETT